MRKALFLFLLILSRCHPIHQAPPPPPPATSAPIPSLPDCNDVPGVRSPDCGFLSPEEAAAWHAANDPLAP